MGIAAKDGKPRGLLQFYHPSMFQEVYDMTIVNLIEGRKAKEDERQVEQEKDAVKRKAKEQESARLRKEKSQLVMKEKEIHIGI
jgi:hypothetical protein